MAEQTKETVDQAVHRLEAKAKELGVQIFLYALTGEYFATSTSSPDQLHRFTLLSCDCPGVVRHQRCTHHAALLAELGQLSPRPPASITPITGADAAGPLGSMVGTIAYLTCRRCGFLAWRGSCVFDNNPNASHCYECATAVAVAA